MKKPLLMSVILIVISLFSLLANMLLARQLTLNEYGVVTSFFSLSVFLGAVSNLGLSQYLLIKAKNYRQILYTGVVSTLLTSLSLYAITYYLLVFYKVNEVTISTWLYIGSVTLIVGFFRINASLSQIIKKYYFVAIFNGASQIVRVIALFSIIPFGVTLVNYNKTLMAVNITALIISCCYVFLFVKGVRYKFYFRYLFEARSYSYSTILSLGYTSALSPYILMLFGSEISAYYNFYLIFFSAASVVYNSFYNNYYLKFFVSEDKLTSKIKEANKVTFLLVILCSIGIVFFYLFFENLIFGSKFQSGHIYIYLLCCVLLVRPVTSNFGMVLSRKELIGYKNRYQLLVFTFSLVVIYISYLLSDFWLACIGIVFSEIILLLLYYRKSKRVRNKLINKERESEVSS